jgi:hypothetical protein
MAVFSEPVVLFPRALFPNPVFPPPVVLDVRAYSPSAELENPEVFKARLP